MNTPEKKEKEKEKEKEIEVELLYDVWLDDGTGTGETVRVTTNTPLLNDDGTPVLDPRTKLPVTKAEKRKLPASVAQTLINQGKAKLTAASMEKLTG